MGKMQTFDLEGTIIVPLSENHKTVKNRFVHEIEGAIFINDIHVECWMRTDLHNIVRSYEGVLFTRMTQTYMPVLRLPMERWYEQKLLLWTKADKGYDIIMLERYGRGIAGKYDGLEITLPELPVHTDETVAKNYRTLQMSRPQVQRQLSIYIEPEEGKERSREMHQPRVPHYAGD